MIPSIEIGALERLHVRAHTYVFTYLNIFVPEIQRQAGYNNSYSSEGIY